MRKTLLNLLVGLSLVAGAIAPAGLAFAEEEKPASQSALQITPSGARLNLSKGDVLEGYADHCPRGDDGCSITVTNIGSSPIRFRVYMSPYAVSGEGNELSFAEENANSYTQLYKWITVKNSAGEWVKEAEFAADPNGSQKIEYKIEVPEDLPGGSQYAVIWAQIINTGESGGIETVGQIGAVLTARSTEGIVETAEVTDLDFTKFAFNGPLHASATVKNTGNVDFAAHYYYTAKTIFGKVLHQSPEDKFVAAYPGTTYHINYDWENTPFLGIFQVEWKITAAGHDYVQSAVVIIMPIIVLIVMILLLTVIIIWIIIISRKRKERKARKLA